MAAASEVIKQFSALMELLQDPDGNKLINEVIFGPGKTKYRYCKHIAKQHLPNLSSDLMKKGKKFILIRNPLNILPSFDKVVPPSFFELGIAELVSIYSELCELGSPPPVIDADDLQRDPEVGPLAAYYKLPLNHVLVAFDDTDLPCVEFFVYNLKEDMGAIMGIGRPPGQMDPKAFVFQKFNKTGRGQVSRAAAAEDS